MIIYTGRFQPIHNGHLSLIKRLRKEYPNQTLCIAVIKDVSLMKETEFDKTVNGMLTQERNPFNAEITLRLITEALQAENIENVVVTLMPRASVETWRTISEMFDCERIWAFTQNLTDLDDWEDKKSAFYQSMGEVVVRIPIVKDINGSEIRQALNARDLHYLQGIVPVNVYEYLKSNLQ